MKKLIAGISFLLLMLSFFATAYADVPDPYGRPRPRPRPPRPVVQVYEKRNADFTVEKGDRENAFLLKVTLPGPCDWHYTVDNIKVRDKLVSDMFFNTDFDKETDTKEFVLDLSGSGEETKLLINVQFNLYTYMETRFGPKLYNKKGRQKVVTHVYRLEKADGQFVLKPNH